MDHIRKDTVNEAFMIKLDEHQETQPMGKTLSSQKDEVNIPWMSASLFPQGPWRLFHGPMQNASVAKE